MGTSASVPHEDSSVIAENTATALQQPLSPSHNRSTSRPLPTLGREGSIDEDEALVPWNTPVTEEEKQAISEADGDIALLKGVDDFLQYLNEGPSERTQFEILENDRSIWNAFNFSDEKAYEEALANYAGRRGLGTLSVKYIRKLLQDAAHDNAITFWADNDTEPQSKEALIKLRTWLWNFTDKSAIVRVTVGDSGYLQQLLHEVQQVTKKKEETGAMSLYRKSFFPLRSAIGILHNCSKHPKNRVHYRDKNAINVLLPLLASDSVEVRAVAMMTMCYIVDESQNGLLMADGRVLDFIITYFSNAMEESSKTYDGFNAWELCTALSALARVDDNKQRIAARGGLPPVVGLLQRGDTEEKLAAATTLWQLAFQRDSRAAVLAFESDVVGILETEVTTACGRLLEAVKGAIWELEDKHLDDPEELRLVSEKEPQDKLNTFHRSSDILEEDDDDRDDEPARSPVPRITRTTSHTTSKKKKAEPQLIPIHQWKPEDEEKKQRRKLQSRLETRRERKREKLRLATEEKKRNSETQFQAEEDRGHIMLSYNHQHQHIMVKVRDELRTRGYRVWMDIDHSGAQDSLLQMMADAVEKAEVVVVCMSERYKDSNPCRSEAEYSYQKNKRMLFLNVQQSYKPDGWLGILWAGKKYIDFSGKYEFEPKLQELLASLGDPDKTAAVIEKPIVASSAATVARAEVAVESAAPCEFKSWSCQEVQAWLEQNSVTVTEELKSVSGTELEYLKHIHQGDAKSFVGEVEGLGLKTLQQRAAFSKAVQQL